MLKKIFIDFGEQTKCLLYLPERSAENLYLRLAHTTQKLAIVMEGVDHRNELWSMFACLCVYCWQKDFETSTIARVVKVQAKIVLVKLKRNFRNLSIKSSEIFHYMLQKI